MQNKIQLILIFLVTLLFQGCIDEYQPKLDGYTKLLVVDGGFYDGDNLCEIRLSYSSDVYTPKPDPISGAQVIILDNFGNEEQLFEVTKGSYQTSGHDLVGIPGRSYKLIVELPDGKRFESGFEKLRPRVPIESITYRAEIHDDQRYTHPLEGYQFYLNTSLPNDTNNFYLWRMVKTYEYHSEFLADAFYNGRVRPFPKPDSFLICWKTENVKKIISLNTKEIANPDMKNFPLNFVNTQERDLAIRYTQLTEQLTVNEDAFNYYKLIEEGNGEQGSLYAHQPFQIRGNITNVNEPDKPVLGYFLVAGRSSQRLFAPPPAVNYYYYVFVLTASDYEDFGRALKGSSPSLWPIYLTRGGDPLGGLAWPAQECIDCRKRGGTLTKPSFWDVK